MPCDTTQPYPRDLVGHGAQPHHEQWPHQARIAVQFVFNYEEGGENSVLRDNPGLSSFCLKCSICPATLTAI
jgi:hypothetical protein